MMNPVETVIVMQIVRPLVLMFVWYGIFFGATRNPQLSLVGAGVIGALI